MRISDWSSDVCSSDLGREVFRHAVTNLASVLGEVMADVGLSAADIDWVVPHQANKRIIDATAKKLGLPAERVVLTVDQHANTSAASVPLALDLAVRDGRIKRGDLVVLEAMRSEEHKSELQSLMRTS